MIVPSNANLWSVTIIGRADGQILLSPVNVPKSLETELLELLRRRYQRQVAPAVPASS